MTKRDTNSPVHFIRNPFALAPPDVDDEADSSSPILTPAKLLGAYRFESNSIPEGGHDVDERTAPSSPTPRNGTPSAK